MENRLSFSNPVITLLTDFGTQDYFVAAMKGMILSINPTANIVDISHDIPPQDIQAAAFTLLCCYKSFPAGTIHVAVVDPGVGSDRKPILIQCAQQFFVGPDNGTFSWICAREKDWGAIHLTNDRFFRHPVSNSFHGRDIFAPVAAALSMGSAPAAFGELLKDIVQLESLAPSAISENTIQGRIIHIDHFGNCVTTFSRADLALGKVAHSWKLLVNDREIKSSREFFSEAGNNEIFCIFGSAGFLEISARDASAAEILNLKRGQSLLFVSAALTEINARCN